MSVMQKTLTTE